MESKLTPSAKDFKIIFSIVSLQLLNTDLIFLITFLFAKKKKSYSDYKTRQINLLVNFLNYHYLEKN